MQPPDPTAPLHELRAWKNGVRTARAHSGFLRTIRRDGLSLPTYERMLSESDITALRKVLGSSETRHSEDSAVCANAKAALVSMLATGRTASDLAMFRFTTASSKSDVLRAPSGVICRGGSWGWWLPAGKPLSPQRLAQAQEAAYTKTISHLWLPCGSIVVSAVRDLLNLRKVRWDRDGSHSLFDSSAEEINRQIRDLCSFFSSSTGTNITYKRVQRWLYDTVREKYGNDHALASLMTADEGRWDVSARSYVGLKLAKVAKIYVASNSAFDQYDRIEPSVPEKLCEYTVGSRYVPLTEPLRDFARDQISILKDRRRGHRIDLVRLHDAMTRYTLVMFALATPARNLRTPPPSTSSIDPSTGFFFIEDKRKNRKEQPDGYRVRLSWLPDAVREQLRLYQEHVIALSYRLGQEPSFLGSNQESLPLFTLMPTNQSYSISSLDPNDIIRDLSRAGLKMRSNALRHFWRSELIGRWPGEVTRAFMGHWSDRTEPWCGDSALDPLVFRKHLAEIVPTVIEKLGFQPAAGL